MMKHLSISLTLALMMMLITHSLHASTPITLVKAGKTDYIIVLPMNATSIESQAATILQTYLFKVTGTKFSITADSKPNTPFEILVGNTNRIAKHNFEQTDEVLIKTTASKVFFNGSGPKGTLYAVYTFLERYLGCRRYAAEFEAVPRRKTISVPANLTFHEKPEFLYREVYYPDSKNQGYLDWHKLNRLDDFWGLWGHSFDKLVPARKYFADHPEYYALVDGKRKASQLCLSNPEVFNILIQNLKKKMLDSPEMKYWSVSQNDDMGYCECNLCSAVDQAQGGPQGSILTFVNKVAAQFPDKVISTLSYNYSQKAPLTLKPAKNVQIMLSSINCNRSRPIETDPNSANFRKDLKDWSRITDHLFIWDYNVQFTNYLSPFPNFHVLQANLQFFKANNIKGVFSQGSGHTPAEFSELRGYLLAKLSWDSKMDVKQLTTDFLNAYYGKAAFIIQNYLDLLHTNLQLSGRILDIYGNPVSVHTSYLSPALIEKYGTLFDEAEKAVAHQPKLLRHVKTARLPLEYAILQQSKFFGIEKHGAFVKNAEGQFEAKPAIIKKVDAFVKNAQEANIRWLAEGGMSPLAYAEDWNKVLMAGPKLHLGLHAKVIAVEPFSDEYPNRGAATLTDGSRGYLDHHYNWLGWYGNDLEVIVDLQKIQEINQAITSFLEDQRHLGFVPSSVTYSFSSDGKQYSEGNSVKAANQLYENYDKTIQNYTLNLPAPIKARYVKVKAKNLEKLPPWRYYKHRKPWLFIDEIIIR